MLIETTLRMRLRLAEAIAQAAISHAEEQKLPVSVAVCDEEGRIFAFLKMDGTDVMSGHEAMRRAMMAAGAEVPSELAGEGRNRATSASMEGIGLSRQAGGLPLISAGTCFGGIGVCGGTPDQAVECARVGVEAVWRQGAPRASPGDNANSTASMRWRLFAR